MHRLELRIPPLILVAAAALSIWLLEDAAPFLTFDFRGQAVAATTLSCFGLLFCVAGVVTFHRANTTTNPMMPRATSALVTKGVYRFSRNPMYVGFVLVLLGWTVFLGNASGLAVIGVFVWYLTRFQIIPEERALLGMFATEYEAYCGRVRRWI